MARDHGGVSQKARRHRAAASERERPARRRVRITLSAAFLVTALALASSSVFPSTAISKQLQELIALGDDHAAAVDALASLRGKLSDVRMQLARVAAGDTRDARSALDEMFLGISGTVSALDRFADTPFEKTGLTELRAAISRSASRAELVRVASTRPASKAISELPGALSALAEADGIAQRLVEFNASQVQSSARGLRASLRRAAAISALLGAVGLAAALVLLNQARTGFGRYSAAIEAQATEMAAFAGRAAHELRNPMQTVALALAVLRSRPTDNDALTRADAGLKRLNATVDRLLEFAAAGGTAKPNAVSEIAPVVDEVVAELAEASIGRDVHVRKNVEPSLSVAMESSHLGMVIANLVTNAAKYGRTQAGVHVEITAVRCGPRWTEITVADDGPGIPAHAVPHVFDPLYRASSSPGGYGLGLATTKRLVEAHGGDVAVDTCVARGARIKVRLPAAGPAHQT